MTGELPEWERVLAYPIMRLYVADQDELEFFQNSASMSRRLERIPQAAGAFETSHLLTAVEILRNTDYLMPAPPFLLSNASLAYRIQALPLPPDIDYRIDYVMVRHQRTQNSPVHNWLWQQMLEVRSELELDSVQMR